MTVSASTWVKPNSSMFIPLKRFLADRPVHWIRCATVFFQSHFDNLLQSNFVAGIWKNTCKLSRRWKFVRQFYGYVWNIFQVLWSPIPFIVFNCIFQVAYIIYTNDFSCWWMPGCNHGNYFPTKISPCILRSISANNFSVSWSWSGKSPYETHINLTNMFARTVGSRRHVTFF